MFEKTLTDIVKGIRATKRDTGLYISSCISEIKSELSSTDPHTKANALQKLTFLQMMGYNMSWASFATIEVMSSTRFAYKRIGYLAASQGFTQDTDVVLLTTNLLKKELRGAVGNAGVYEAGLALNCLSNIVTEDLARELLPEVTNLTSHSQPYLRKKAVLCLFKLFVKYPQGLRLTFGRIQQCLEDGGGAPGTGGGGNSSVVSCAVNVITELSDKNPKNYLVMAPAFFGLLTSSSNNWMLIKIVKLLGSLVGEEPRLARKLLEPLAAIVRNTQAKSLLYEAVYTITLSLPYCRKADGSMPGNVPEIVTLCAVTLRSFVEETDQNLKYLGLVGFGSLMMSHPKVLSAPDYRPLILACLSDEDVTIRTRALDLLPGMATRKNLVELVTQLLRHVDLATGNYKAGLVYKIVDMCSFDKYALLQDFAWYLDILVILAHTRQIDQHGLLISGQIVDVALRVLPVRAYVVRRMIGVLLERSLKNRNKKNASNQRTEYCGLAADKHIMPELLPAAAWIVGEYSSLINEAIALDSNVADREDDDELHQYDYKSKGTYHAIIQSLTAPSNIGLTTTATQSVYVQASLKVLAAASVSTSKCTDDELRECVSTLALHLPVYMQSTDAEVQERAFTLYHLMASLGLAKGDASEEQAPDVIQMDKDEDESFDENDGKEKETSNQDDLLGLAMSTPETSLASKLSNLTMKVTSTSSVASKCRAVSASLIYLLIPEPMKPVNAKAQRKKLQTVSASIQEALDAPVNMSVFSKLLVAERDNSPSATNKSSIEIVSFTQQTPMRTSVAIVQSDESGLIGIGSENNFIGSSGRGGANDLAGGEGGYRHVQQPMAHLNTSLREARHQDPFYLSSGGETLRKLSEDPGTASSRFGTIQLIDSDNDDNLHEKRERKKKKKKDRKIKESRAVSTVDTVFGDADFDVLTMGMPTTAPSLSKHTKATLADVTVYSSDEDNVDDQIIPTLRKPKAPRAGGNLKGFEGLAMVDLSTPLRADEVMPKNEHRVVPERRTAADEVVDQSDGGVEKKTKKVKKNRKGKRKDKTTAETSAVGDLLDFGYFNNTEGGGIDAATTTLMPINDNTINSAFDDLLTLDVATPSPPFLSIEPKPSSKKKGPKKLWQIGTIKPSGALGGGSQMDWEQISLHFRVHYSKGSTNDAMVTLRIVNHTTDTLLQTVQVAVKGAPSAILFGDIEPGTSAEGETKAGPFVAAGNGLSPEIKGTLKTSGWTVPVTISLPSTFTLSPVEGLKLDHVFDELSGGEWSSHSLKLDVSDGISDSTIRTLLCSFLRADEVNGSGSGSGSNRMLASKSALGVEVRVLLKILKGVVKIDVKCTDKQLGRALASDLKRLMF